MTERECKEIAEEYGLDCRITSRDGKLYVYFTASRATKIEGPIFGTLNRINRNQLRDYLEDWLYKDKLSPKFKFEAGILKRKDHND